MSNNLKEQKINVQRDFQIQMIILMLILIHYH